MECLVGVVVKKNDFFSPISLLLWNSDLSFVLFTAPLLNGI